MKSFKTYAFLTLLAGLVSCRSEVPDENPEAESNATNELVTITEAQFKQGKMTFGSFSMQTFDGKIHSTGMLDVPPENNTTISAYFGGYVKSISLLQGQKVTKGQTLFILENPEYLQVQQDFLESQGQLTYLKADYERQKELAKENVTSQKNYLKAESEYKVILARYESLKRKLQLMSINPSTLTENNIRTTISVSAPSSGFVTSVKATTGMYLNPSDIALTIINTDQIHVELSIFEQDLTRISIGQSVTFTLQNNSQEYEAVIHLINKAIDPVNRTVNVHCDLKNAKDASAMTPGMFVEAEIASKSIQSLALPEEAIVSIEAKNYVLLLVKKSNGNYDLKKTEVVVGQTANGFIEIKNSTSFPKDAQILTQGAFNLITE